MEYENKAELRKKILAVRNGMSAGEREKADFLITEKVLGHNWFQTAEQLLVYINTGSEVDTRRIMQEAFRLGKQVFAPKVHGEEMCFYQLTSFAQLEAGFKGILEPVSGLPKFWYEEEKAGSTLMLMPGVAFDKSRNRIGYGKGYYDRYLQDKQALHKMALAYECQVVEAFEVKPHDLKPDVVVTQTQRKGGFQ